MRSFTFQSLALFAVLIVSASAAFAQSARLKGELDRSFTRYDLATVSEKTLANGQRKLSFDGGQRLEVILTPHDLRTANFRAENTGVEGLSRLDREPVSTFLGIIAGQAGSQVRINFNGSRIEGFIASDGGTYFVEPAGNYSTAAKNNQYVLYKIGDVLRDDPLSCGSQLGAKIERGRSITGIDGARESVVPKRIELATEADLEYVNTLGGPVQANNEILGILNTIEGLYSGELILTIAVVYQHTWTTADPFAGANSEITVRNFQAHWNANFPLTAYPRDAAHLFSGKANVLSQGWAFIGVVCRTQSAAYGLSGYVNWAPAKYLITGHELGHNLGANHADAPQNCGNTLMNAQLSGSTPLSFCEYSRTEVNEYLTSSGTCITPGARCSNDLDGDAKTDLAVFRPSGASGAEWWYLRSGDQTSGAAQFGLPTDTIAAADYTGDRKTDIAFFRPSTGFWYVLRSEDFSFYAFPFGGSGDVPVPADYDADGKADAAVYRPSNATWYIANSGGGTTISQFGSVGDRPVTADYDGDGKSDFAVFRNNAGVGEWWIRRSTDQTVAAAQFGSGTDRAVPGDYTGDGKADIAMWRPSNGNWYILRSEDNSFYAFPFGGNGDVPSPGDYDGDGKTDAAVFRPSTATWFANNSGGGTLIQQFGAAGDIPVPTAYVR